MDRIGLICRYIKEDPRSTQRDLAQKTGFSVGTVNTLIKEAMQKRLIAQGKSVAGTYELTGAGDDFLEQFKVDGALIIAAGFGSRFVPLTFETPKGLLEVFGERMIERQIRQLHEVGITDITIAVGYLKEKFEYLIDKYQVKLLYNPEYASKNTLTTIYRARKVLAGKNMYILSSDNWLRDNMFHAYECGAWYASSYMEGDTSEWCLSFNKKGRITHFHMGDASLFVKGTHHPCGSGRARFLGHVRTGVLFRIVLRTVSASSGAVLPHPRHGAVLLGECADRTLGYAGDGYQPAAGASDL